jgi:predicted anti-sigma-YlaC factor YlaD
MEGQMNRNYVLYAIAGAAAASFLIFGLWPFFDSFSFYEEVADYPPYNAHFLHDVGAFQIGLGAVLVFALIWPRDAILVALLGTGVAAAFHFVAHVEDEELGGTTSQTITLGLLSVLLLGGAAWQWARTRGSARPASD